MKIEELICSGKATAEEIKDYRNSFDPDVMGYSDEPRDLSSYEDKPDVMEFVSVNDNGTEIDTGCGLTIKKLLTPYNFTDKNSTARIEWIVIHYFGGLGTAFSVANYFYSGYRGASAHYALDDQSIVWQCVNDDDVSWHCGDAGVGEYKHLCKNSNSIGIEVRPHKIDTSRAFYASDNDWYFDEQTEHNLELFVKYLMEKYDIPADHVIRHYDVTHKRCPACWEGNAINKFYGVSGNQKWNEFKEGLEDENMTVEKFTELYNEMLANVRKKEESKWSKDEGWWSKATEKKLVDGTAPQAPLTRQEFIAVIGRKGLV